MSRRKGGFLGIEMDDEGYLLEGSMSTVGVLLKNGDFVVPPPERILAGTTVKKAFQCIEDEFIGKGDYVKQIVRRDILVTEAQEDAVEVMQFGGEACTPILEWDGVKITDEPGPLARGI